MAGGSGEATATRPAYEARGGFAGWGANVSTSRKLDGWRVAGYMRADRLNGAAFADCPLVRQRQNLSVGLVASWIFKTLEARAR